MKQISPKTDNAGAPNGQLTAPEFNDFARESENSITDSGQTLEPALGGDVNQLSKAIGIGGVWKLRATAYQVVIGDHVIPDNSSAPWTGDMPSSPTDGQKAFFKLLPGPLDTNTVTIEGNGNDIGASAETSILIDVQDAEVEFRFDTANTIWLVV